MDVLNQKLSAPCLAKSEIQGSDIGSRLRPHLPCTLNMCGATFSGQPLHRKGSRICCPHHTVIPVSFHQQQPTCQPNATCQSPASPAASTTRQFTGALPRNILFSPDGYAFTSPPQEQPNIRTDTVTLPPTFDSQTPEGSTNQRNQRNPTSCWRCPQHNVTTGIGKRNAPRTNRSLPDDCASRQLNPIGQFALRHIEQPRRSIALLVPLKRISYRCHRCGSTVPSKTVTTRIKLAGILETISTIVVFTPFPKTTRLIRNVRYETINPLA